jgi:hypothetical protein
VTDKLSISVIATIVKQLKSITSKDLNRNTREEYKAYLPDTVDATARQRRATVQTK